MTSTAPAGDSSPRRRRLVVVAFAAAAWVALVIAGLGMTSLFLDEDIVTVRGLGGAPGTTGVIAGLAGWLAVVLPGSARRPGVLWSLWAGVAGAAAYTAGLALAVLVVAGDPAGAVAAAIRLVTYGFAAVVALAGVLAAVGVAVTVRAGGHGVPRWPWEPDEPE